MKTCPLCAEEIQEAAIRCKHCGSDIQANASRLRVAAFVPTKKGAEIDLVGCSPDQAADAVERFFVAREFRLESGNKFNATYGIGSAVGRALAGGLVKRSQYAVAVSESGMSGEARPDLPNQDPNGGAVRVVVASQMSGMSGSLVGVGREQAQRHEFVSSLKTYLAGT